MRRIALVGMIVMLAGCGVDGPPEPPAPHSGLPTSGVAVSGDVRAGIAGGTP